ncbi:hypothetical protein SOHN41_00696 [Shewanella sp. HN-41]|nr:hypothetical protein SOHN41_00696 [Shewanella sp. HN-41]
MRTNKMLAEIRNQQWLEYLALFVHVAEKDMKDHQVLE